MTFCDMEGEKVLISALLIFCTVALFGNLVKFDSSGPKKNLLINTIVEEYKEDDHESVLVKDDKKYFAIIKIDYIKETTVDSVREDLEKIAELVKTANKISDIKIVELNNEMKVEEK